MTEKEELTADYADNTDEEWPIAMRPYRIQCIVLEGAAMPMRNLGILFCGC